ncbi:SGNH/GDSL hydrolase family protein [uncultured Gordonia sp.]|uniref:SGNH/GDSL hydrolase family protein n=1 Tax=uncultured Gordonia sp. TaxID=198437 RepID=UPI00260C0FEA|nr:SGNH/GDSL hydrolase family protein [uncultured Gordonia sp.]
MRATVGIQMWGRRFAVAAGAVRRVLPGEPAKGGRPAKTITNYVALGDSYAAGTAILPMSGKGECGTSAINYPSLVAKKLRIKNFTDVTCGGAKVADFTGRQGFPSPAPPQFAALRKNTELVTVGIGGNDIHLVELTASCINPAATATSRQCAPRPGGRDKVGATINAFGPKYDKVIAGVRERSPKARILLVGYPYGIRPGGCPGRQPMGGPDATYIQDKISQLNRVMKVRAEANGAEYVDIETPTKKHEACSGSQSQMVGVLPTDTQSLTPLHPNAAGQRTMAATVLKTLEN